MNGAEKKIAVLVQRIKERNLKKQSDEGAENEAARECYKIIISTGNLA